VEQRGHQEARIGHRGERPDLPQDESDGGDDLGPDRGWQQQKVRGHISAAKLLTGRTTSEPEVGGLEEKGEGERRRAAATAPLLGLVECCGRKRK